MTLSNFTIALDEVKNYLRVENNLDDLLIGDFTAAAIEEAGNYLNRDWPAGEYPTAIKTDILTLIAWKYENRGDMAAGLPPIPLTGLNQYRLLPGL